jgi:hypothetical protein
MGMGEGKNHTNVQHSSTVKALIKSIFAYIDNRFEWVRSSLSKKDIAMPTSLQISLGNDSINCFRLITVFGFLNDTFSERICIFK